MAVAGDGSVSPLVGGAPSARRFPKATRRTTSFFSVRCLDATAFVCLLETLALSCGKKPSSFEALKTSKRYGGSIEFVGLIIIISRYQISSPPSPTNSKFMVDARS